MRPQFRKNQFEGGRRLAVRLEFRYECSGAGSIPLLWLSRALAARPYTALRRISFHLQSFVVRHV